jgi:hypothetical protein
MISAVGGDTISVPVSVSTHRDRRVKLLLDENLSYRLRRNLADRLPGRYNSMSSVGRDAMPAYC